MDEEFKFLNEYGTIARTTELAASNTREVWPDQVGTRYAKWLEETANRLQQFEQKRETAEDKLREIVMFCNQILNDGEADMDGNTENDDTDKPKMLVLKKKH